MAPANRYNAPLHYIALLTAAATFPLIFMGGLVTSHGAALAVPDWPNTFGYNMWLFPPRLWEGGIFYEHTHRLVASIVGLFAIVLAAWACLTPTRRSVRWLALAVLGAVILQGVIGGLRVVLLKLDLAILHACLAQAVFCLTALVALVTSRSWEAAAPLSLSDDAQRARPLVRLAALAVLVVYAQLVLGAFMRHYGAGLAIPDLPLAYGKLLPPTDPKALRVINWDRVMHHLQPVSASQIWLHFAHRIGALLVTAVVLTLVARIVLHHRNRPALLRPAIVLLALLAAQIALGVFTVLFRKPADVASAHVAAGALVLMISFILTANSIRLCRSLSPITGTPHRQTFKTVTPSGSSATPGSLATA